MRFLLSFPFLVFLSAFPAIAAGPDQTVACVEQQLAALGHAVPAADGKIDPATRSAASAFKSASQKAAIRALPPFKLETAVSWCREIGLGYSAARKYMPSAKPPIVLAHGGRGSMPYKLVARAFGETETFFRKRYGFHSASRVDIAGSHDIRELSGFAADLQRTRGVSYGGMTRVVNRTCNEGYSYGGVAYKNQLLVCWPTRKTYDSAWYKKVYSTVAGIMVHEYMHHVQRELTNTKSSARGNPYGRGKMGPAWMVEGSAEVVQFDWVIARKVIKDPGIPGWISRSQKIKKTLRNMHDHGSVKGAAQYRVAHLAAQLLADRFGDQAIFNYWRLVGRGHNWETAFQSAFGMRLTDYERLFETLRRDPAKASAFARGRS